MTLGIFQGEAYILRVYPYPPNHKARYTTTFDQRPCSARLNFTPSHLTNVKIALLHSVAITLSVKPARTRQLNKRATPANPESLRSSVKSSSDGQLLAILRFFQRHLRRWLRLAILPQLRLHPVDIERYLPGAYSIDGIECRLAHALIGIARGPL